jgi:PAS domain
MLARTSTPAEDFNAAASREGWPTRCDPACAFEDARLAALLDIWRTVRGTRTLPLRGDFSARTLARHLQHLTFVERVVEESGARRYRFRLFGSALASVTGDWTGRFLDEAVPGTFLPSWLATYDTTLAAAEAMRFTARFRAAHLEHILAESLVAPLGDESGAPAGLLVSVNYSPAVA